MSAVLTNGRPRGRWIPWLFVGGFVVVCAVNGVMIWAALSTWTGLAANQPYDRGLAYNQNLAAAARQAKLGWRPVADVRIGQEGGEIDLVLMDAGDQPVTDAQVVVEFERPTFAGSDFAVDLSATAPGHYRARFDRPLPGVWDLHATIRRGTDLFVHEQRVLLP